MGYLLFCCYDNLSSTPEGGEGNSLHQSRIPKHPIMSLSIWKRAGKESSLGNARVSGRCRKRPGGLRSTAESAGSLDELPPGVSWAPQVKEDIWDTTRLSIQVDGREPRCCNRLLSKIPRKHSCLVCTTSAPQCLSIILMRIIVFAQKDKVPSPQDQDMSGRG